MKTMTKKLGAIILALAMCFSLTCVAFAASDYTITIENANLDQTYTAYKIFDATYVDGTDPLSVSYTINESSAWYATISSMSVFTISEEAIEGTDSHYVTVADGVTDDAVIDALKNVNIPTGAEAADSQKATSGTLTLDVGEAGYYYITTTTGTTVTITTAAPSATVIDKNEVPGSEFHKYIEDQDGNLVDSGQANMGDVLSFDITSDVPLYEGENHVLEYQFTDTLADSGMEIEIEVESYEGELPNITTSVEEGVTHYYATDTLINTFVTMTDSSGNKYSLSDVAYGITLEFTDVHEEEINGQEYVVCGGFILTYYTYNTETYATDGIYDFSKYLTDLTIDIKYSTYVTTEANHFEVNTAVLNYWVMGPNDVPTPGTNSGTSTDDTVYEWDLNITKLDSIDQSKTLAGAEFTLEGENLKYVKVSTTFVYTLYSGDLESGVTYYYLLADGRYTTTAPAADGSDADKYDPEYPGPYTRTTETNYVEEASDEDGTNIVYGETAANGTLKFDGLTAGTYTLTEVVAPDGYNLLDSPIIIVIDWVEDEDADGNVTGGHFELNTEKSSSSVTANSFNSSTLELSLDILNSTGSELPSTGGIGTTIFYIIGGVLVAGAVVVLITRRRMSNAD